MEAAHQRMLTQFHEQAHLVLTLRASEGMMKRDIARRTKQHHSKAVRLFEDKRFMTLEAISLIASACDVRMDIKVVPREEADGV